MVNECVLPTCCRPLSCNRASSVPSFPTARSHRRSVAMVTRAFAPDDVAAFLKLTGDANPIHVDEQAAAASGTDSAWYNCSTLAAAMCQVQVQGSGQGTHAMLTLDITLSSIVGRRLFGDTGSAKAQHYKCLLALAPHCCNCVDCQHVVRPPGQLAARRLTSSSSSAAGMLQSCWRAPPARASHRLCCPASCGPCCSWPTWHVD